MLESILHNKMSFGYAIHLLLFLWAMFSITQNRNEGAFGKALWAVSYTHLDVYKRQQLILVQKSSKPIIQKSMKVRFSISILMMMQMKIRLIAISKKMTIMVITTIIITIITTTLNKMV